MFDFLFTGFFALLVATTIMVAIGGFVFLIVTIARESGWVSCLCASMGYVGIAFLTLGVPFWGPSIPTSTIGIVMGLFGWTNLMFVFGSMALFHHEIGQWAKKRMRNNAMRRHPSYR